MPLRDLFVSIRSHSGQTCVITFSQPCWFPVSFPWRRMLRPRRAICWTSRCSLRSISAMPIPTSNIKRSRRPRAPAQRLDMCTITPHAGAAPTVNVTRIPLAAGTPPGKPACAEQLDARRGVASCNVIVRDSIVSVSLVSGRDGFATLSAAFRSHFERLFTPGSVRR